MLGRDEYPMPAATVAAKFDVVALGRIADRRLLAVCGAPRLPRAGAVREERAASLSRRLVVRARSSPTSCAARSSIGRSARPIAGR
jgi:hypothetical protein